MVYRFRKDLEKKKANKVNVPRQEVMLCLNESPFNPLSAIKKDFFDKMENFEPNRYFGDMTKKLTFELTKYIGYGIEEENILWGNGADELLYYIFTSLNEPQNFITSLSPSYFDYKSYSSSVGLNIKFLHLNDDFEFDADQFLEMSNHDNCKMLIICNPNNPTGNLFSDEKIEYIIANTDKLVLIDEAYFEFSGKTFVDKIKKYDNLLVLRTFSKGFSSAGLRFGYLVSQSQNISEIKKVMTVFHMSLLIQNFALSILENKDKFLNWNKQLISERDKMISEMKEIRMVKVERSFTNFIPFSLGQNSSDFFEYLKQNEIAIRDISAHPLLKNYLRVTIGSKSENQLFLNHLKEFSNKI